MSELDKKLSMSLEDLIASQKAEKKNDRPVINRQRSHRNDRRRERPSSAMEIETKKTIVKARSRSRSHGRNHKEARRIVKVSNIDPSISWKDLKEAFSSCGSVDRCDVDGSIAIIIFREPSAAKKAISAYDGGNLNGRRIRADFA